MPKQLSEQQKAVILSTGDIKINAVAGSGKTTTLIEYAGTRPPGSRILYIAFNKSVRLEAQQKFAAGGLKNVAIETAHSLAYKAVVMHSDYKVKGPGFKTTEIADLLKLQSRGERHSEYMIANHINKLIGIYCNSPAQKLTEINYPAFLPDVNAKKFVASFHSYIFRKAELLLKQMDSGKMEITHDFYLKKFQLSSPILPFDYILFDEAQDASGSMLDIFTRQTAVKVVVGDANQQIYSWRQAVNSLEKLSYKQHALSLSFRFPQEIADLAMKILQYKKVLGRDCAMHIQGKGTGTTIKSKAILARTNLGLLLKAIECVTEKEEVKRIYFEGNIHSYTYADDGASLYDVLNLANGKQHLIHDKLIRAMKSFHELQDYVKKTEDVQLGTMMDIVSKYGNRIPGLLRQIKQCHVGDGERESAELIFSTVHKSKGLEYDEVTLVDDFITQKKIDDAEKAGSAQHAEKLNEEINLLYVAVTRARVRLVMPQKLVPEGFHAGSHVHVVAEPELKANPGEKPQRKNSHASWDQHADEELRLLIREGMRIKEIADHFGRTRGAIESRIKKLALNV